MSPAPSRPADNPEPVKAARRLSGLATNLLATGLILVAGLALGRQVLVWWKADQANVKKHVVSPTAGQLGSLERPHRLEFGELPGALRRAMLVGSRKTALAALREQTAESVSRPIELSAAPGPAEQRMLSHIGRWRPVLQDPGRWEVYQLDGPVLLAAGIQFVHSPDAHAVARPPSALGRRVVFWGIAVPAADSTSEEETRWTLFTYCPASVADTQRATSPEMPLPPGARRTLALAAEDGGRLIAFRGAGDAAIWQRFFETQLARDGWIPRGDWQESGDVFHARFEKPGLAADVQWGREQGGEYSGVVSISLLSGDKP